MGERTATAPTRARGSLAFGWTFSVHPAYAHARAELTAAQRTKAIKRRKQIWEALHPNSGKSVSTIPDRGPGRPKEFAAATAEAAGMTKQAINQHLARAEAIGDDLERCQRDAVLRSPDTGASVGLNVGPCFRKSQFHE